MDEFREEWWGVGTADRWLHDRRPHPVVGQPTTRRQNDSLRGSFCSYRLETLEIAVAELANRFDEDRFVVTDISNGTTNRVGG
jgi:hypothetical protein